MYKPENQKPYGTTELCENIKTKHMDHEHNDIKHKITKATERKNNTAIRL